MVKGMAGITEVAQRAGVSPATASRALTGRGYVAIDTRRRVEDAARELGYVASSSAASLVTGRTQTIGVVIPSLGRWFFAEVLEGIQDALLEYRFDLALYGASHGSAARLEMFDYFLARRRFDGLIAVGIEPSAHETDRLMSFGKPVVSVGGYDMGTSAVSIDDIAAARIATEHLLSLGHREIVFLGGDPDGRHTSFGDALRLEGYQFAMRGAGLTASARHIPSPVSIPGGFRAAVELLGDSARRPTGIVGICDEVAIGAIIAARRLGLHVPAMLSVVGIDDHTYAEMFSLTTLRQNPHEQGRAAVEMLMRRLADPGDTAQRVYESSPLVLRTSTTAIDDSSSAIVGVGR